MCLLKTGYKDVAVSDEDMAYFYEHRTENIFECAVNEYVVVRRKEDWQIAYKMKWDSERYIDLKYKPLNSDLLGKTKPRNLEQELAFDMLQNSDTIIKCLTGVAGGGKDYLMVAHACNLLKEGSKFNKIIWVRNNVEVKDTEKIGMLPGTEYDKLLPFLMPLADHLGDIHTLNMYLDSGKIEVAHLGFLRGRDLRHSIIYCSEAENLTKEHMRIIMTRCSEGSELWLNGDYRQVDKKVFEGENNGLVCLINSLEGQKEFGHVQLKQTERGRIAELSELL